MEQFRERIATPVCALARNDRTLDILKARLIAQTGF